MRLVLAIVAAALLPLAASAAEVAGVKLDDKIRVAPSAPELVLNGAGVRTRFFVKVYVGALYLTEKKTAAADVLALGGPKRVHLAMLREVTGQQMSDAIIEGFQANNSPADQGRYKAQIAELAGTMNALGAVKNGDALAFEYLPDTGMRLLSNGEVKGKTIADAGFYRALLRVWLGDKPVDADLKKGLLGQM